MICLPFLSSTHVFVAHLGIFKERGDRVEAEAAHPALEPEADDVFERLVDLGIVPVEVGLLDIKLVVVVLAGLGVPLPRRVAEVRLPVVRRLALVGRRLALAIVPHVPVAVRIGARRARLKEPLVLVGSVVHHHVHHHADVALVGLGNQVVKVGHGAVLRIDVPVVGDVVAEVNLRRGIDGREPDGVDAQFLQVVEALR